MTREETINFLKGYLDEEVYTEKCRNAHEMAIKSLEQPPILDKIRAEILEEKECAYADFEQYKVDYLGVDAEYAEDELPLDDFRYGMERAIEIIDKYKMKSEDSD